MIDNPALVPPTKDLTSFLHADLQEGHVVVVPTPHFSDLSLADADQRLDTDS